VSQLKLRLAKSDDLDFILTQESRDDFANLILRSRREEHINNLNSCDKRYFIVEDYLHKSIGYLILFGLTSPHRSIELTRIVMVEPGRGNGKLTLRLIIKKVFEEYGAHRFWLDVFEFNQRARKVYRAVGFQEEGLLREAVKRGDKYYSLVILSLIDREYFQNRLK
jgi:RimJ/RimL family protein N-acetyltransferase